MKRYTIAEFKAAYPNDDACLDRIFQIRYSNLVCPKCESIKPFVKTKERRSYYCPNCAFQIYPTEGTVFEKTTTPLSDWFFAIYLQTTTRNGVAAKELERQISVCYKTALRMNHQIKKLMANKHTSPLSGIVEVDEVYIGGKMKNKHKKERAKYVDENNVLKDNKVGVMGFLERGNVIRAEIIKGDETFKEMVRSNVDKEATLVTDSHLAYRGLDKEYKHEVINHTLDEYVRGDWHTNTLEGFWSLLRRTITGTHIHVSEKHLQKYIDEVAFRYMQRDKQDTMFETILSHVA